VTDRIWMTHPASGGHFHCPQAAAADFASIGWEPCEAPPEPVSPVIAEHLAWRAEQDRIAAEAASETPKSRTARRGETPEE